MLVGIVASPCHSAFTLPNALAPTFPLVGAFLFLTRQFHEWPAATADMTVLPVVLGCSFDRLRTGSPCDVLFKYASDPTPRYRGVARRHSHLHGLATAIHEIAGLGLQNEDSRFRLELHDFRKQSKIFYSIIHSDVGFSVQLPCFFILKPDT
jgi:hypothetical protein